MRRVVAGFAFGLVFGGGIALAGMINPAKVLNFFDVAGTWDPSLAFVMAGALLVTFTGYRLVLRQEKPVFEAGFQLPAATRIDRPLVAGAALFGIGWGIAGFCPGGAIPALGLGEAAPWAFVAAMLAGILLARTLRLAPARRPTRTAMHRSQG